MVECRSPKPNVAGSSPASPANFDPKAVIDAVVDYNMAEIYKKMDLHGVDFELAWEMQKEVIIAEGRAER